jgi:preprotein translocase subunit SecD
VASSSPPVHPYRYLAAFLIMLIAAYAAVFFTGDRKPEPKLGIDLQGGTRVTLTARTPDGSVPTRDSMDLAKTIINDRVNGLGVSGGEVVTEGDNLIIITVPGNDSSGVRDLGQTARLYIRPVIHAIPAEGQGQQPPAQGLPGGPLGAPGLPGDPAGAPGLPGGPPGAPGLPPAAPPTEPAPQPRPYPEEPPPTPPPPAPPPAPPAPPKPGGDRTKQISDEKALRQSTEQQIQVLAMQFQATRCNDKYKDALAGNDDPKLPLVTCSQDHKTVYLLAPSIISGEGIKDASSGLDSQRGQYVVDLEFKGDASTVWADFTAANVGTQTAFTLDSEVVSAPEINEAIPGGRTQITGDFNAQKAKDLALVLKYGSLPLSFESSQAETVSATLGLTSLRAGLIAGAIGLALVLLYSLLYYRVLGLLTALSLIASGAMVFAILVLLGRSAIHYTLDLAGIAGLIIGIGTTADSFVVFFERIKDEIREGRSYRSAVPRGWARARKTILSGNAVSFLAAAVLYVLAAGQVKGFAFTLGLTTILDVVVVFLVTWPLVYLSSKSAVLSKPAFNGLGAVQQIARERRAATYPLGRR